VRILVVAHEASRTGSPMVLLGVLRWMRRHTDHHVDLLVLKDGALRPELAAEADSTRVVAPGGEVLSRGQLVELGLDRTGQPAAAARVRRGRVRWALRGLARPDVVYLNSVPAAWLLPHLPWSVPVVTHVHELRSAFERMPAEARAGLLARTDRFLAVSGAVEAMLLDMGVDERRVVRRYEHIDPDRTGEAQGAAAVADELGIPAAAPVVLGAGTADWRKGPDLFVQVAVSLRRRALAPAAGSASRHRNGEVPHLVWVGAAGGSHEAWPPTRDVTAAGLGDVVHLPGEVPDLTPWLQRASLFVLTSREDPFPLVCLEAAWHRTPFVAFDCGGIAELAGEDGGPGLVVPPTDVEAMAEAVQVWLDDPAARAAAGAAGRRAVERSYVLDAVAPAVVADLEEVAAGG